MTGNPSLHLGGRDAIAPFEQHTQLAGVLVAAGQGYRLDRDPRAMDHCMGVLSNRRRKASFSHRRE